MEQAPVNHQEKAQMKQSQMNRAFYKVLYNLFYTFIDKNKQFERANPTDYEQIDEFYAFLGYEMELENSLHLFGIQSTSDLLEVFIKM